MTGLRLCIADPPYLGSANRWYGTGRGSAGGRHKADEHPDARLWDREDTHIELVQRLDREFDGWALAGNQRMLPLILEHAQGAHVAIWVKPNAMPSGARIVSSWEPVVFRVPDGRRARDAGPRIRDVITASVEPGKFAGSKPSRWTRWVLDMLGYKDGVDEVFDLFPGSGAVAYEIRQGIIA